MTTFQVDGNKTHVSNHQTKPLLDVIRGYLEIGFLKMHEKIICNFIDLFR